MDEARFEKLIKEIRDFKIKYKFLDLKHPYEKAPLIKKTKAKK